MTQTRNHVVLLILIQEHVLRVFVFQTVYIIGWGGYKKRDDDEPHWFIA